LRAGRIENLDMQRHHGIDRLSLSIHHGKCAGQTAAEARFLRDVDTHCINGAFRDHQHTAVARTQDARNS